MQIQDFTYNLNTAYNPITNSIVQYSDTSIQYSLVMYINGVEFYAIKLDCGNPVGTLQPLIGGLVYYYNGSGSISLAGVPIQTCVPGINPTTSGSNSGNDQTGSGGGFIFSLNSGTGFCIGVPSTYTSPNGTVYSNPEITPGAILNGSPPGGGPYPGCDSNTTAYEYQIAAYASSPGFCNYPNANDLNYNIAYTSMTPPSKLPSKPPSKHPIIVSNPCLISSKLTASHEVIIPNAPQPAHTYNTSYNKKSLPPASTTPDSTYIQANPGALKITSAHDQYPISVLDPNQKPTPISWTPIGYQKSHKFTLNYSNYIKDYPYDNHKTTVLYTQKYTEETFTSSSSPSFYTCPNGGSVYD